MNTHACRGEGRASLGRLVAITAATVALALGACSDDAGTGSVNEQPDAPGVSGDTGVDPTDPGGPGGTDPGSRDPGTADPGNAADPGGDSGPPPPGAFGAACAQNEDCDSGYCVQGPDGQQCTKTCIEECPTGYACKPVGGGADVAFICVYKHVPYCAPCDVDADCAHPLVQGLANRCVPGGDAGAFCGTECTSDAGCPAGASCQEVTVGDETTSLCRPDDGLCTCTAYASDNGASTACAVTNTNGTCTGRRACGPEGLAECDAQVPAAELCDGADNDCDGDTDEDGPESGGPCDGDDADACEDGTYVCTGGVLSCDDDAEAVEELCDGIDNDCDGVTDALDPDLAPAPCEKTEGACAGATHAPLLCSTDGWAPCPDLVYIQHDPTYEADSELSCDGIDNDCDGETDEDFLLTQPDGTQIFGVGQTCGAGACAGGTTQCNASGDGVVCSTSGTGNPEVCDGVDNDCDGLTDGADDGFATIPCELQKGVCNGAVKTGDLCVGAGGWGTCGAPQYSANNVWYEDGKEASCDNLDNDCDGETDEDFVVVDFDTAVKSIGDACGTGLCAGGTVVCAGNTAAKCSTASNAGEEVCDGLDNDCDGGTDEGCDDDGDGYCDAGMGVTGTPPVCSKGTLDCADGDPDVHPDAAEVCNLVDDDCDGETDGATVTDCPAAGCAGSGNAYLASVASSCNVDGQCGDVTPESCGNYTCVGGGATGDTCATSCSDDSTCVDAAHCDEDTGICVTDIPDGGVCTEASDCVSGHCANGFCCATGDCCNAVSDCPLSYASAATCDDQATCQGTRADATCVNSMCGTTAPIPDDSACTAAMQALDCSPNQPQYCTGAPNQTPPQCGEDCTADTNCLDGYHCDGTCQPDVGDGGPCDEDTDCTSGYCSGGFCCASGDCCSTAADCPVGYASAPGCDDQPTCQGTRLDATCIQSICGTSAPVDDDTACAAGLVANDCGLAVSVTCSGSANQVPPSCPGSCTGDAGCDDGAHCDGTCLADLPDGDPCDEDSDCIGGHCQNGFCCDTGDCCQVAGDCPASYSSAPACGTPSACQGTADVATCVANMCGTQAAAPNDSACAAGLEAKDCGPYPAVTCAGGTEQTEPLCATSCGGDGDCDADAHCAGGKCVADKPNGEPCTAASQCVSGHCQNGFCCASGDCCASAGNCDAGTYGEASSCLSPSSCQGERRDPTCVANQCALGPTVPDDSGCAGQECTLQSECASGLVCVDGVCCTTDCAGTCRRCDLPGKEGTCSFIAPGADPDNECDAISCAGYYWGFDGRTCYDRADISADSAVCNGLGACDAASTRCILSGKGDATVTCNDTCQLPAGGSCSGTTPGACTNQDLGTVSCGTGACQRTVDKCIDGTLNTCSPGSPSAEVCNGVDDDCDGLTDSQDATDLLTNDTRPCEDQDGVCAGCTKAATLCSGGGWQPCSGFDYASCTSDYEPGTELSCDGKDNDCDSKTDTADLDFADDIDNCGACGTQCTNAHGSTQCSSGTCTPTCTAPWANCDGDATDGCETSLDTNPGCPGTPNPWSAAPIGVSGDEDGPTVTVTGTGEKWFVIYAAETYEDALSLRDLSVRATLTPPAGANYDLELWCDGCNNSNTDTSTNPGSNVETVQAWWEEECLVVIWCTGAPSGSDSDGLVWVRVKYVSGDVCAPWQLDVKGNVGRGSGNAHCSTK